MSEKQKEILANICESAKQLPADEQEKLAIYAEGFAAGHAAKCSSGNGSDADNEAEA